MSWTVHAGNVLEVVPALGTFDAVLCDPPYGFAFMGKEWDRGVPGPAFWEAIRGRLRPGAHLMAFGGPRTQHRLGCAIEDGGFEIRDVLAWIFGSGFPKSHNVSVAIDRAMGAEREVVGAHPNAAATLGNALTMSGGPARAEVDITAPATPDAQRFDGYGTAMKPSHEPVLHCVNPCEPMAEWDNIVANLRRLEARLCLLRLTVVGAAPSLACNRSEDTLRSIAEWNADDAMRTRADLFDRMDMSLCESALITSWNIACSWLRTSAECLERESTSTTSTATSPTIDLITLKSSASKITPVDIIEAATCLHGAPSNASHAARYLIAAFESINATRTLSALERATSRSPAHSLARDASTAYEPVILARVPLAGTIAANCLEHGTGALNIDGARIGTESRALRDATGRTTPSQFGAMGGSVAIGETTQGRWPANLVLDEEAGRALDGQSEEAPSRFFYEAKASRTEREAGLAHRTPQNVNDGRATSIDNAYQRGDTQRRNVHPTIKPIDLNRWLATLLLPPPLDRPRRLLVPFSGAGSEMIGALLAGWDEVVGVELSPEYADIARARLAHWERYRRADSEAAEREAAGQLPMFG